MMFTWLPQGQESLENQEKPGKTKKNQEKKGVFENKSGNLTKFEKTTDFVISNLQNFLFSKALNCKKLIKNPFKVRLKLQNFSRN